MASTKICPNININTPETIVQNTLLDELIVTEIALLPLAIFSISTPSTLFYILHQSSAKEKHPYRNGFLTGLNFTQEEKEEDPPFPVGPILFIHYSTD